MDKSECEERAGRHPGGDKDQGTAPPPTADEEEEDDEGPILPGMWMDGDSLAPPCQSELGLVGDLIEMAGITDKDVSLPYGAAMLFAPFQ